MLVPLLPMEKLPKKPSEYPVPEILPILPSGDAVVYPSLIIPLATRDEQVVKLIDHVVSTQDKLVGVFAENPEVSGPPPANLFEVGTAALIVKMFKLPDGSVRAVLQGLSRIRIKAILETSPFIRALVEKVEEKVEEGPELEALVRNVVALFQKIVSLAPHLPEELGIAAMNIPDPGGLADFVAAHMNLNLKERQEILELADVKQRLLRLTEFLNREIEILELRDKIQSQVRQEMDKAQREFFLREQLKAIQRELGELDERTAEINELRQKIEAAGMPPEVKREAEKELERLSRIPPQAAEYTVARTYLDWLISLPWSVSTEDNLDLEHAAKVLDEDHYNLEKVKERILEYLAVRKLKPDAKGPILCFKGPPGVGKTSMGKSIARALGRKFVRISLGGVRDEAEIRGHRRTYVGALPGRIIQGLRRAGSNNPVFMIDEIDKIGADFRGDPAAALLEVLDPEQNYAFVDHYLDVPFDLSKVMFIATANVTDTIPPALLDRMEVIELPGYTEYEKLQIAKRHLIPKQLEEHGLSPEQLEFGDDAIMKIIRNYTREAGLRNLEREIGAICRKVARKAAENGKEKVVVTAENVKEFLGPEKYRFEVAEKGKEIGVATGLAWTLSGGDILFVEAALVPGRGEIILTGQLGDVMQESAKAAITYIRSRWAQLGVDKDFHEKHDIHIHVPAGAIPKDGPSAGITMAVAIASALTKKPASKEIAMTGEITLRGKVLPVGGIREKVLAAHRAGIRKVVLPKENERNLEDVPEDVKKELDFIFVEHADEVLKEVLGVEVSES